MMNLSAAQQAETQASTASGSAAHGTTKPVPTSPLQDTSGRGPISVLIAEDHPLYREGLVQAVSDRPGLRLVADTADGEAALLLISAHKPDVALVDVKMPGMDGVDLCRHLSSLNPPCSTRVLLLSAYVDRALVSHSVQAGAAGYLGKHESRYDICEAVERVGRGGTAFSGAVRDGLIEGLRRIHER